MELNRDTNFEKAISKEWQEFCKLGGLHYTEEAQVMLQKIEGYWAKECDERVREERERIGKELSLLGTDTTMNGTGIYKAMYLPQVLQTLTPTKTDKQ